MAKKKPTVNRPAVPGREEIGADTTALDAARIVAEVAPEPEPETEPEPEPAPIATPLPEHFIVDLQYCLIGQKIVRTTAGDTLKKRQAIPGVKVWPSLHARGKVNAKFAPPPSVGTYCKSPPICRASRRHKANPTPMPGAELAADSAGLEKGRNNRRASDFATPDP